jgi:hypothetical protein
LWAGLLAGLLSMIALRRGLFFSSDGWAYWQGSVCLLRYGEYRDFYGLPILSWPPLFPLYLASWQSLLGVSGLTLVVATSFATAVACGGWTLLMVSAADRSLGPSWRKLRWMQAAVSVYLVAVLVAGTRSLRSETLLLALLALLFYLFDALLRCSDVARGRMLALGLGATMCAALLVRNASLVFLAAGAPWILWKGALPPVARAGAVVRLTALALVPWLMVRAYLGQLTSHEVGLEAARYAPWQYLVHFFQGVGDLIAPYGLGVVLFAVGSAWVLIAKGPATRGPDGLRTALSYALLSGLLLIALFSVTELTPKLRGRFVVYIPLVLLPSVLCTAIASLRALPAAAVCLLLLAQPCYRLAGALVRGRGPIGATIAEELAGAAAPGKQEQPFVRTSLAIDPDRMEAAPRTVGRLVFVKPPLYPWMKKRLESGDP